MNSTNDNIQDAIITALSDVLKDSNNFTAQFLAEKFCDFPADKQGEFFDAIAYITDNWTKPATYQWRSIEGYLTARGKRVINDMYEHTTNEYRTSQQEQPQ